jgi:hypothetical protein
VGGEADPSRDLFWGSVVVQLQPNQPVPIPSVAPGARILSVRTRPELPLRFYRDGADNFFVVSTESGQSRVIFVTDGASSYFGAPVPADARASEIPAPQRPRLPPGVQRATEEVSRRLGLDPAAPVARNLTRLITYLRSFRSEATTAPAGADPYLTLALGRRGVCRHRAFVFVVTAQGLGLPARFVSNEVHAFAEVLVPRVGWLQVDLGGEGPLTMANDPVARHEPRSPDPFPWPPTQPPPRVAPSPSEMMAQARSDGRRGTGGQGQGAEGQGQGAPGPEGAEGAEGAEGREGAEGAEGTEGAEAATAPEPTNGRDEPLIRLERHSARVIRGEALTVSGLVENSDGPMAGVRVRIWIVRGANESLMLGSTLSGADGSFRGQLAVPTTVPTGDYVIVARPER